MYRAAAIVTSKASLAARICAGNVLRRSIAMGIGPKRLLREQMPLSRSTTSLLSTTLSNINTDIKDSGLTGLGNFADSSGIQTRDATEKLQAIADFRKAAESLASPQERKKAMSILTPEQAAEMDSLPIEALSTIEMIALAKTKVMNLPRFRSSSTTPSEADISGHNETLKQHNRKIFHLWKAIVEREPSNLEAVYATATCYRTGRGVPKDAVRAHLMLTELAGAGMSDAQFALGSMYSKGEGCEVDHEKAFKLFMDAGRQGSEGAVYNLSICFAEGKGVPQNAKKAVMLMEGAVEAGDPMALYTLGCWCLAGKHGLQQDITRGFKLHLEAAKYNHPAAIFNLGTFYMTGDNLPPGEPSDSVKAAQYYEKAANLGFMEAALNWAMMMVEGIPPLRQDVYAGRDILRRYRHLHPEVRKHLDSLEADIKTLEERGALQPPSSR